MADSELKRSELSESAGFHFSCFSNGSVVL